ncbi:hypothetical protein P7B02_03135 [Caulobacter segnis]|uniref:hypothetical protein n=1 Tax=Caulobacter segnis TaxID=88688 RepID=UPI00240F5611|nr:hypothetical protein [Caulobacter segnis]MDG2520524.1 hypothetical protein [Caulobacter segnis]
MAGKRIFAAAGACALICCAADSALARQANQSPPAEASMDGYVQLIASVAYGGAATEEISACPTGKAFGTPIEQLLNADQKLLVGTRIDLPGGKTIELAPITITVERTKVLLISKTKCNVKASGSQYVSPLYTTQSSASTFFRVSPLFHQRTKPTEDFLNSTAEASAAALKISQVTAPFADGLGLLISRTLGGGGYNISQEVGVELSINPALGVLEKEPDWKVSKNVFGGSHDILVKARIHRVATYFNPLASSASNIVTGNNYLPILSHPFYNEPVSPARTMDELAKHVAATSYDDLLVKTAPVDVNKACTEVYAGLQKAGLSQGDAALVVWALGRKRSAPLASGVYDQVSCIQANKNSLTTAGVVLETGAPPPPPPGRAPTAREMNATLTNIPLGSVDETTDINAFFKSSTITTRNRAASRLFVAKASLDDPNTTVFNVAAMSFENQAEWAGAVPTGQDALFANLGCYSHFDGENASVLGGPATVAIGRTPAIAGGAGREAWVILKFEKVVPGENARIGKVEIRPSIPDAARGIVLGLHGSRRCGSGTNTWEPELLR